MANAPIVVVTAPVREDEGHPRVRLMRAYLSALERAGLLPLISAPMSSATHARDILAHANGLLLTGGEDVDPALYGALPHPALGDISHERDVWEIALIQEAHRRKLATLAICRGIQVANVAFGGTLIQDLPSERPSDVNHHPAVGRNVRSHALTLTPTSRVAEAMGGTHLMVNSIHHQAVDRVGAGLRVTGHAPDDIVEAIESDDAHWWMLAVQWHPEELDQTSEQWDRGLFAAFAHQVAR